MKRNIKTMLPAMLLLAATAGCKKNTIPADESNTLNAGTQKIKAWYEAQPATTTRSKNTAANGSNMPAATVQWGRAVYMAAERGHVIPAMVQGGDGGAYAYLLIMDDAQGAPVQAQYSMILPDKKQMSAAAIDAIPVTPGFLQGKSIPAAFSGAVLQFTGSGTALDGVNYANGQATGGSSRLSTKTTTSRVVEECEGENVCTDWYWQTYVDGTLINEDYLFTTCTCSDGFGGGGAGGGLTQEQICQNALNIFAGGSPVSELVSVEDISKTDDDWYIRYGWRVYRNDAHTWALMSTERARAQKNSAGKWEYTAFYHHSMYAVGSSQVGSNTFVDNGANINMTPQKADVEVNYTVKSRLMCGGKYYDKEITPSSRKIFTLAGSTLIPWNPDRVAEQ